MKKLTLSLVICAICSINLFAQHFPYIHFEGEEGMHLYRIEHSQRIESKKSTDRRKDLNLIQSEYIHKNKKGKITGTSIASYNKEGQLISSINEKEKTLITYLNDTIVKEVKVIIKDTTRYTYNYENNRLTNSKRFRNNKLLSEIIITYNSKGKVTNRLYKYSKNFLKTTETKNFYNADGKIEKTQNFINNKLKREYLFECKPEGEMKKIKKVEQTTSCKWTEERNDGSYVTYYRNIHEKDEILWKTTFSKDSVLISQFTYLNDTIKLSSSEYFKNYHLENGFKKNGEINSSCIILYLDNNLVKETRFMSFGLCNHSYSYVNEYDQKENLVKTTIISEGKVSNITECKNSYRL